MLGRTAGGLFWMFRSLERAENTVRLIDAGWRIALTRSDRAQTEWESIVSTTGLRGVFLAQQREFDASSVIDFLLRDPKTPSSVISSIKSARTNARMVRTALSAEVWEATNECWMVLRDMLARPVTERNLHDVLTAVRSRTSVVRGALYGTMLRNDIFDFARLGTYIERADNTARILDMKYYVLLPSVSFLGTSMDNAQWETILRSVSAESSFRWLNGGEISPMGIAEFLILDQRMPRSLAYCYSEITDRLNNLQKGYGRRFPCQDQAEGLRTEFLNEPVGNILDTGLHEFLTDMLDRTARVARQIEVDFRFSE